MRGQQQPAHADADADERRQQVHAGGEQRAEGQHQDQDRDVDADELGRADRSTPVRLKALPPTATSRPASSAAAVVACERVEAAGGQLLARHVELDRGQGRPAVGAERLAVERADHARRPAGPGRRRRRPPRSRRVGGVGHGGAVGGHEDDLRAGARRRRARARPAGRAPPATPTRDGEAVVEGAADGDQQGDDDAEQREPGDGDHAAVPEGGAAEPREERAHGKGSPGSVGGGGTQQEEQGGALEVGGGAVAGGAAARRRPAPPGSRRRRARPGRCGPAGWPERSVGYRCAPRGLDERGQPAVQLLGVPTQRRGRLRVPGGVQGVLGVHQHPGAVGAERGQAALDRGGDRVGLLLEAGELLLGRGEVAGGLPSNSAPNSSSLVRKLE